MSYRFLAGCIVVALSLSFLSCGRSEVEEGGGAKILVVGSDTMVNLAQAWAEEYTKNHPEIRIQVRGGGSGVGIASLIEGTCDMASASREMKQKEKDSVLAKQKAPAVEHTVGYDALAVYVHKDNPLDSISIEELAEIFGDGGKMEQWSDVDPKTASLGKIVRVSRQNSSGTYAYFREAVLGEKREYKLGSIDQSGSKDVVSLVGRTAGAIGYSGMGYATDEVKMLKIAKTKGGESVDPTVENAKKGSYPITRALYIYTVGEAEGALKDYLDWIYSAEGQKVVAKIGYVPIK